MAIEASQLIDAGRRVALAILMTVEADRRSR